MTSPTQAQIEAAAKAMFDREYASAKIDSVIPKYDDCHKQYWTLLAEAALTAAAQVASQQVSFRHRRSGMTCNYVGEAQIQTDAPLSDYDVVVVYKEHKNGLLWARRLSEFYSRFDQVEASAQVGELSNLEYTHDVQRRALLKCEEIEAATIERCAQVALAELSPEVGEEIAAAIRKLKDTP